MIECHIDQIALPKSLKELGKNALPAATAQLQFHSGKLICRMYHDSYEISELAAYLLGIGAKDYSELRPGSRMELAANALSAPGLPPAKDSDKIEKTIKTQKKKLLSIVLEIGSAEDVKGLISRGLLSEAEIADLLEKVGDRAEIKALLLEQLSDAHPPEDSEKDLFRPLTVTEAKKHWSFAKNEAGDGYIISSYKGDDTLVTVPEMIGTLPVKEVGAFCNCGFNSKIPERRRDWLRESVMHIIFPAQASVIGDFACPGLKSLKEVTIPQGVIAIGKWAFEGCAALQEIVLPSGLLSLDYKAFASCSALCTVSLPASLKEINEWSFDDCPNLTIHAPAGSYAEQYAKEHNIPFVAE